MPRNTYLMILEVTGKPAPLAAMVADVHRDAAHSVSEQDTVLEFSSFLPQPAPGGDTAWALEHWGTRHDVLADYVTGCDETFCGFMFGTRDAVPFAAIKALSALHPTLYFRMHYGSALRRVQGTMEYRQGQARETAVGAFDPTDWTLFAGELETGGAFART